MKIPCSHSATRNEHSVKVLQCCHLVKRIVMTLLLGNYTENTLKLVHFNDFMNILASQTLCCFIAEKYSTSDGRDLPFHSL